MNKNNQEEVELKKEKRNDEIVHRSYRFYKEMGMEKIEELDEKIKENNWKIKHRTKPWEKNLLESTAGYKNYKESIFFWGPQGNAIMHANYRTYVHKLIINLNGQYESDPNTIKAVKNMFELNLETTCYDENNLPEGLVKRIESMRRIKQVK